MTRETPCPNPDLPFSFMKTSLFLLLFIFLVILFVGIPISCVFFILKPKMPLFSLETVKVDSYNLYLNSENLLVSSVSSLYLRADNPNKVGLSFDPSRLHILSQGLVVGLIRIPQFHQPPSSKNVSIQTRVLFERINISEIVYGSSRQDDSSNLGVRILGDVRAQVKIFRITLPKIKVALDCDINVSQSRFSVSNIEDYSMRWNDNHLISLALNSQTVSKKCSLAILV